MSESDEDEGPQVSMEVMINKERNKVLFAEADSQFVDILLSFLTLPLGRIVRILEKEYGDEAPTIGSLSSLYSSLEDLDSASFVTEDAKNTLLNPTRRLELDVADYQQAEYFCCPCSDHYRFRSVSMYYDNVNRCRGCGRNIMRKEVAYERTEAVSSTDGVFTMSKTSFLISDDLQIFPNETGLLRIISILGIENTDHKARKVKVDFLYSR